MLSLYVSSNKNMIRILITHMKRYNSTAIVKGVELPVVAADKARVRGEKMMQFL